MSGGSPRGYRDVTEYIDLFRHVIGWALAHGASGDWNKVQRTLDALSTRLRADEAARGRSKVPDWAYRLEHQLWIDVLTENLHPIVLDRLVDVLYVDADEVDPRVWAPLEVAASSNDTRRRRQRAARADAGVLAALRQYEVTPRHARIVEGVRALEELHDARLSMDPVWDVEVMRNEARRLADAINNVLPPGARRLLSAGVESLFRSEIEGKPIDQLEPERLFWHHRLPGLGVWYPAWWEIRTLDDAPEGSGEWFVPEVQEWYEAAHLGGERKRAGRISSPDPGSQPTTTVTLEGTRSEALPEKLDVGTSRVDEDPDALDEMPVRGQHIEHIVVEPNTESATLEESRSTLAERRLKEWCDSEGITPKHLTEESRAHLMAGFRSGGAIEGK